jgi:hypothetical protein
MDPVPNNPACVSENVSDKCRDADERNCRHRIEWFDDIDRANHVRPKDEINDGLSPSQQDKERPNDVLSAN